MCCIDNFRLFLAKRLDELRQCMHRPSLDCLVDCLNDTRFVRAALTLSVAPSRSRGRGYGRESYAAAAKYSLDNYDRSYRHD